MCFKHVLIGHILCLMWKLYSAQDLFFFFPEATLYTFWELVPSLVDSCNCRKAAQSHLSPPSQSHSGHQFSFFGVHPCDIIVVKSWLRLSTHVTWVRAANFEGIFGDLWDINKAESSFFLTVPLPGSNQRFKHRNVRETHRKKERNISLRVGLLSQSEAFQLHSGAFGDVNKLRELNFNLWLIFTHHTWGEMQMSLSVSVKRQKTKKSWKEQVGTTRKRWIFDSSLTTPPYIPPPPL